MSEEKKRFLRGSSWSRRAYCVQKGGIGRIFVRHDPGERAGAFRRQATLEPQARQTVSGSSVGRIPVKIQRSPRQRPPVISRPPTAAVLPSRASVPPSPLVPCTLSKPQCRVGYFLPPLLSAGIAHRCSLIDDPVVTYRPKTRRPPSPHLGAYRIPLPKWQISIFAEQDLGE